MIRAYPFGWLFWLGLVAGALLAGCAKCVHWEQSTCTVCRRWAMVGKVPVCTAKADEPCWKCEEYEK